MGRENLSKIKMITMATNLLHKVFMEMPADYGEEQYKTIRGGEQLFLTTVEVEDGSQIPFYLELDRTNYSGALNFAAFDASVRLLIANLVEVLNEEKDIMIYKAELDANTHIFGVTAAIQEAGITNVLVLGCGSGRTPVVLRLSYLSDSEYVAVEENAPTSTTFTYR